MIPPEPPAGLRASARGPFPLPLVHSPFCRAAEARRGTLSFTRNASIGTASVAQTCFEGLRHFKFLSFLIAHRAGLTNKSLKSRGPLGRVRATLHLLRLDNQFVGGSSSSSYTACPSCAQFFSSSLVMTLAFWLTGTDAHRM